MAQMQNNNGIEQDNYKPKRFFEKNQQWRCKIIGFLKSTQ